MLLSACGGGGAQPDPPTDRYTLTGTVRTPDGTPIHAAQVLLGQRQAVADHLGQFSFTSLQAGYYIATVQDASGNLVSQQLQLSAASTAFDFTLPHTATGFAVLTASPLLNSPAVGLNSNITLGFSQPLDPAKLVNAAAWFNPGLGSITVRYTAGSTSLILDPDLQLPLNQQITIELPASLASASGSTLGHPVRWRFNTAASDLAGPELISNTPPANATAHPPNLSAVFEFNEQLAGNPLPEAVCTPPLELSVTVSGRFVYVQPASGWGTDAHYALQVTGVADTAGNIAPETHLAFKTSAVPAPSDDIQPSWNRVDNTIVFASNRYGSFDIFQANLEGTALVRLTALPGDEQHPTVSRDGSRLVFQYREPGGKWHLYSQRMDGIGEALQLTAGEFNDEQPVFSNTLSNQIAFTSDRVDPAGIFLVSSDGSSLREIDRSFGSDQTSPAFHPLLDTQLVFSSHRAGSQDVWRKTVSAIDGSTINLNLTGDYLSQETAPVFSPDASYILFVSDYSGAAELWIADADGAFPRQLTYFQRNAADPVLSPAAGTSECVVSLVLGTSGRGLALVDTVSGTLIRWLTGGEEVD